AHGPRARPCAERLAAVDGEDVSSAAGRGTAGAWRRSRPRGFETGRGTRGRVRGRWAKECGAASFRLELQPARAPYQMATAVGPNAHEQQIVPARSGRYQAFTWPIP